MMTKTDRYVNIGSLILPFAAVITVIVFTWNELVHVHDLVIFAVGYVLTGLGITVGFHRMLTHRAFQTSKPVEYTFAVLGSMGVQGPVEHWVADHRKHHAHTDVEGDPHSPHVDNDGTWRGALRGLFHAHVGWLTTEHGGADRAIYAKDLIEDPGMRWISRNVNWLITLSLILPAVAGYIWTGTAWGAFTAFLWGGLVRVFLLHHVTFSINSICHFFGRRRFANDDYSTNVWWLSLLSFGESWHHNHHAFPRSFAHGLRRYERALDPGAWVIWTMEKLGLAWNVTRIAPERQAEKLAQPVNAASTVGAR